MSNVLQLVTSVAHDAVAFGWCLWSRRRAARLLNALDALVTSARDRSLAARGFRLCAWQLAGYCALLLLGFFADTLLQPGESGGRAQSFFLEVPYLLDSMVMALSTLLFADAAYVVTWLLRDLNTQLSTGVRPQTPALRHEAVCDVADEVGAVYTPLVPTVVIASFCGATTELYNVLTQWRRRPGLHVLGSIMWVVHSAVFALQLAHAGAAAASEATQTPVIVHKVMGITHDDDFKDELSRLSLQLMHRQIRFTACGFFPIDFTLLYSMVGAVTTFLVILVQFQSPSTNMQSCNNTVTIGNNYSQGNGN